MADAANISFQTYLDITNKKAQYGRYLDTKQWSAFRSIALPDAHFEFRDTDGSVFVRDEKILSFESTTAFVDFFSKYFAGAQTLHMFGPPHMIAESSVAAGERVKVTWAMEDQLYFSGNSKIAELRGGGKYAWC